MHGAVVRVTAMEVDLADGCLSTSVLSMYDESTAPDARLKYPGVEARCNSRSTIPPSTTCMAAKGTLTVTSTPGVRHRLYLQAELPADCPQDETENDCTEGPCCEEGCTCRYYVGSQVMH
jgi:hypothetical protein